MPTLLAHALLATNSVFLGLATFAVALRFAVRQRSGQVLGKDDWFVVAALIFAGALCLTNLLGVPLGNLGEPFDTLTESQSEVFLKFSFAWQFPYLFAVAAVKFSVLFFYARIFDKIHGFQRAKSTLVILTSAWLFAFFWATLFQAWPMNCNWDPCPMSMDYPIMYICTSATDIALDVMILGLPMTMLHRLQMSTGKKLAVGAIFGLGIFCVVASVARLVYTVQFAHAIYDNDFSVNFSSSAINISLWSGIEACASTLCACLPCFGPYFTKLPAIRGLAASSHGFKRHASSNWTNGEQVDTDGAAEGEEEAPRGRTRDARDRMTHPTPYNNRRPWRPWYGFGSGLVHSSVGRSGGGGSRTAKKSRSSGTNSREFLSLSGTNTSDKTGSLENIMPLPSPLVKPPGTGPATFRNMHEAEMEMGRLYLRTGRDEGPGKL